MNKKITRRIEYAPCMGCTDRHLACHDTCSRYAEYKVHRNEWLKQQHIDTDFDRIGHSD